MHIYHTTLPATVSSHVFQAKMNSAVFSWFDAHFIFPVFVGVGTLHVHVADLGPLQYILDVHQKIVLAYMCTVLVFTDSMDPNPRGIFCFDTFPLPTHHDICKQHGNINSTIEHGND